MGKCSKLPMLPFKFRGKNPQENLTLPNALKKNGKEKILEETGLICVNFSGNAITNVRCEFGWECLNRFFFFFVTQKKKAHFAGAMPNVGDIVGFRMPFTGMYSGSVQ